MLGAGGATANDMRLRLEYLRRINEYNTKLRHRQKLAPMLCARARPFSRDNFGNRLTNTVQPSSSFNNTGQHFSITNAMMPIRPPPVYRNVRKPPPTSAIFKIPTTPVGGQRVLQRPTHVALPQSDTQQKTRHDLIAQSTAALTAQNFEQQQQTAPKAQAESQDDMEFLEEDRKTPPPDDIGMVQQCSKRLSTAGRGQKAREANVGNAAAGTGATTAGKGREMPMVHTLQQFGRTIRYMTKQSFGSLIVPVLSSQPQSTAVAAPSTAGSSTDQSPQERRTLQSTAGKLPGIPLSAVPPSFPPAVKPLETDSLNPPLNPPSDSTAPFDLEEFRRLADAMSDVPLDDVISYVIEQQTNLKNHTPNKLTQLVSQTIADDPNKYAADSSNARFSSAVSKQGIILHILKILYQIHRNYGDHEVAKAWIR
ncbi:hypothetical protein WR25_03727 [Diploscapter pachys]|uniref:Uncharacterized protein n=1 Tax=Diploscapter pachys TaxID=2018661 RepID=A0A2A2LNF7_9BILA|nr:hypothetical protein WR25_03727 [Diploscapter pachys]